MLPLTRKERRKYLAALKEKNASGEHIASDPAGLLLRKGRKDQAVNAEAPRGDANEMVGAPSKGAYEDIIDLATSPQRKKAEMIED